MSTVFDTPNSRALSSARQATIRELLRQLRKVSSIKTAIDVGCGVGIFSKFLADLDLEVIGVEGRAENVAEATRRYPVIRFALWNVEDPKISTLGRFDLVLCTGLLYHLENPFRAVRNVASLTAQYIIVESVVQSGGRPTAVLFDECDGADQGLNYVALIPSESALVRMFVHSGVGYLYRVNPQPDFREFRGSLLRRKQRTMLVGSRTPLNLPMLLPATVETQQYDPWDRSRLIASVARHARHLLRAFRGRHSQR